MEELRSFSDGCESNAHSCDAAQKKQMIPHGLEHFFALPGSEQGELSSEPQLKLEFNEVGDTTLDNITNKCVRFSDNYENKGLGNVEGVSAPGFDTEEELLIDPKLAITYANKYSKKLSDKSRQQLLMKEAIESFFFELFAELDNDTGELKSLDVKNYKYHGKSLDVEEIRELVGSDYAALYDFYRRLQGAKTLYAKYEDKDTGDMVVQAICSHYSMSMFDPVYAWRKNQIQRKNFFKYLANHPEILEDNIPIHMVLTLRHKGSEGYQIHDKQVNKRYFARDLIGLFKQFRSDNRRQLNKYCSGGSYGVENKPSAYDNGHHTHMHCFLLQPKGMSVEEAGEWFKSRWRHLTGATQVHYEPVYYFGDEEEYPENEHIDFEHKVVSRKDGKKIIRKKEVYSPDWTMEQVARAALECMKYNFKPGSFIDDEGNVDVDYLAEVTRESKNLRFTSRFGCLYDVPELSLSKANADGLTTDEKKQMSLVVGMMEDHGLEAKDLTVENLSNLPELEVSEDLANLSIYEICKENLDYKGSEADFEATFKKIVDLVKSKKEEGAFDDVSVEDRLSNMINPFTMRKPDEGDYQVVLGFPAQIKHRRKSENYKPVVSRGDFYQVPQTDNFSLLVTRLCSKKYSQLVVPEDFGRFWADSQTYCSSSYRKKEKESSIPE